MKKQTFESETALQQNPLAAAGAVTRTCPTLSWTDAHGEQDVLIEGKAVLGSRAGVEVLVVDPAVSRLHAELALRDDGLWVRDLGSKNGTFLGGFRVIEARIPDGGVLTVGGTNIEVRHSPVKMPVSLWPEETFGGLVGRSVAMRELFATLDRVAKIPDPILIQGDTGTGKELVARAIHDASPRAEAPFVVVDCAALPENLLESELFGHAKGAFTGADSDRVGSIEAAEGGTVFLDEVGEIPLGMQPRLLRVLESQTIRRVGENHHRKVNVRFLSATHRNLRAMVNDGSFREDLYFRLAVFPVTVPALRERPDDIPLLLSRFLAGRAHGDVGPDVIRELATRPWPGNVRELRSFVNRALILGIDEALHGDSPRRPAAAAALPGDVAFSDAREHAIDTFERTYVNDLLARHPNNVSAAARAAGITRVYLHRLIRKHST